ncbi:MAG: hypothetical protein AB1724_00615 [Thermodesulfobacteriota bacterium]
MNTSKLIGLLLVTAIAVFAFPAAALADDVETYINEGLKYYKEGKFSEAVSSLSAAEQLIQQKKSSGLEGFLPKPLAGWEAEDATSQAAPAAFLGGGITAERSYTKGDSSVRVQIMADSPMLQSALMMISNPMYATADGGKLERIGNQKAVIKFDAADKSGNLQLVAANRFLVQIEGSNITAQELKDYAAAIDYDKLATLP